MKIRKTLVFLYKIWLLFLIFSFIYCSYSIIKREKKYKEEVIKINLINMRYIEVISNENYYLSKKNIKGINLVTQSYNKLDKFYKSIDFSLMSKRKNYYYNEVYESILKHKESFMRAIYYSEKHMELKRLLAEKQNLEYSSDYKTWKKNYEKEIDLAYIEDYQLKKSLSLFEKQNAILDKRMKRLKEYSLKEKRIDIVKIESKIMMVFLNLFIWFIIFIKIKLYKIYYKGDKNGYKLK